LLRCFEKRREQRFQNVAELAAALVPFAPLRFIVHAERAAAILGVSYSPAKATDLLPISPVASLSPLSRPQARPVVSAQGGGGLWVSGRW
jgi:hypothetical protein